MGNNDASSSYCHCGLGTHPPGLFNVQVAMGMLKEELSLNEGLVS